MLFLEVRLVQLFFLPIRYSLHVNYFSCPPPEPARLEIFFPKPEPLTVFSSVHKWRCGVVRESSYCDLDRQCPSAYIVGTPYTLSFLDPIIPMSLLKLPVEIKTKWLAWLRDPTNAQGSGLLIRTSAATGAKTFCCLGGLGEVCGVSHWAMQSLTSWSNLKARQVVTHLWPADQYAEIAAVLRQIDPTDADGLSIENMLMAMNDTHGKTFLEIATWIEETL